MEQQILSIIFSILLLPINLSCAFWLFREALNLTGMTFREFLESTSSERAFLNLGRRSLRKRQRFFTRFFNEKSSDPQESVRLFRIFGVCTLPGLAALGLATYAAMSPSGLNYAFIGDLILVAVNITLVIWGIFYRRNHPLDKATAERLHARRMLEKEQGKKNRVKRIIASSLIIAVLFGVLLFFMLAISGISRSRQDEQSAISIHADLITLLNEKGYETANVPTTYWELDEDKLLHVAAGVKGGSKFEFYGYSDHETVASVYDRIVRFTAPELDDSEREIHETFLPDKSKMFTVIIDGVYYLVMYKNDTLIYAYSPDSINEINEILTGIGYLRSR